MPPAPALHRSFRPCALALPLALLAGCAPAPGLVPASRTAAAAPPQVILPLDGLLARADAATIDEATTAGVEARAAALRARAAALR